MHYDAAVVGAGPGGATAAYVLAKSGLKVALVERRGPPRDKTCGGLLTATCDQLVHRIFDRPVPEAVMVPPKRMPIAVIPPSGRSSGYYVRNEYVLNITRRTFDGWLTRLAVEAGSSLIPDAELVSFEEVDGRIQCRVKGHITQDLTADFLVGADGIYSRVRAQISPRKDVDRAYYIQEYYPRTGHFEDVFYLMYRGDVSPIYAYIIPKFDTLCLGIGVHRSRPPTFRDGMQNFKLWLADDFAFDDLGRIDKEGFSVPFGGIYGGHGQILLVGDAAGFCFPITGEGITFAIQTGAEAATAIATASDSDVAKRYWESVRDLAHTMQVVAESTLAMSDWEREQRIGRKHSGLSLVSREELRTPEYA